MQLPELADILSMTAFYIIPVFHFLPSDIRGWAEVWAVLSVEVLPSSPVPVLSTLLPRSADTWKVCVSLKEPNPGPEVLVLCHWWLHILKFLC